MLNEFKVFGFLKKDISRLEGYLEKFTDTLEGILKDGVENTLLAGGKRIRSALFFICARNTGYDIAYLLPAAASIEIIHTASLIHDDIIDKSELRRGKKTIHSLYDNDTAKYIGNYLFTHTFSLLNTYRNPEILREMSSAAEYLVRGEFDQLKKHKNLDQDENYYFSMISKKTSSLFKGSCALGGLLSGAGRKETKKLSEFGRLLGIAFQINDDLLDVDKSMSRNIGKPVGNDIRQGNITLPIIYALKDKKAKKHLEKVLGKDDLSNDDIREALELVNNTDAVDVAKAKLAAYLGKARKTAGAIREGERRKNLLKVCDYFKT